MDLVPDWQNMAVLFVEKCRRAVNRMSLLGGMLEVCLSIPVYSTSKCKSQSQETGAIACISIWMRWTKRRTNKDKRPNDRKS